MYLECKGFAGMGRGLPRHAVAEVDDSRAEGAGLDELEIHPALTLGKYGMPPPTSTG